MKTPERDLILLLLMHSQPLQLVVLLEDLYKILVCLQQCCEELLLCRLWCLLLLPFLALDRGCDRLLFLQLLTTAVRVGRRPRNLCDDKFLASHTLGVEFLDDRVTRELDRLRETEGLAEHAGIVPSELALAVQVANLLFGGRYAHLALTSPTIGGLVVPIPLLGLWCVMTILGSILLGGSDTSTGGCMSALSYCIRRWERVSIIRWVLVMLVIRLALGLGCRWSEHRV